jgi:hypothetical protein
MNDEKTSSRVKPGPRWLKENQDFSSKAKKSKKHENRIASAMGGKRLPASGAKRYTKWLPSSVTAGADVGNKTLHMEAKRAEPGTKSIGVTREWLLKVTEGSARVMKTPAMVLTFEEAKGFEGDWVLLPLSVARRLLGLEID